MPVLAAISVQIDAALIAGAFMLVNSLLTIFITHTLRATESEKDRVLEKAIEALEHRDDPPASD